jgi:hypothetical protein
MEKPDIIGHIGGEAGVSRKMPKPEWEKEFVSKFFVYKLGGKFPDHVGAEKEAVKFIKDLLHSELERQDMEKPTDCQFLVISSKLAVWEKALREEFEKLADDNIWKSEDGFTSNIAIGNVIDWWISKLHSELEKQTREHEILVNTIFTTKREQIKNSPKTFGLTDKEGRGGAILVEDVLEILK